jgi:dihydroorotase
MYDLVIKSGRVIDPSQELDSVLDVAIQDKKVAALKHQIPAGGCRQVIDATDKIVTPGLIDLHTHVYHDVTFIGVEPDIIGVNAGVTTVVDAGSSGPATLAGFRRFVISQASTSIFPFLNICSTGLCVLPEIRHWDDIDIKGVIETVEKNRDLIKGIKVRLVGPLVKEEGLKVFKTAKKVAVDTRLPLMVHIGDQDAKEPWRLSGEMLPLMEAGDVLSHIYSTLPGRVFGQDGKPLPQLEEARERGVFLEVARGRTHMSYKVARAAIEQGIIPSILSTDVTSASYKGPVYNLLAVMSQFMALGLGLEQLVRMTTVNPARVLRMEDSIGNLKVGTSADISILRIAEGKWTFVDSERESLPTQKVLMPIMTIKSGREIRAETQTYSRFEQK